MGLKDEMYEFQGTQGSRYTTNDIDKARHPNLPIHAQTYQPDCPGSL